MKICYLANAGSVHTQRWLEYFATAGHEVHVISHKPFSNSYMKNVRFHSFATIKPRIRIVSYILDLIINAIQARKLSRQLNPDILHTHYLINYGFLGALSGFHPLVVSAWGSDVMVAPERSWIKKLMVRFALAKADIVLTTSEYLKRYLIGQYNLPNSKVKAFPWGVNLNVFNKGYETEVQEFRKVLEISRGDFVVLSPRHLREHYRIETIIKVIPYVLAKYARVTLILLKGAAEDKHFEIKVDKLIEQLGIGKNVKLIRRHLSAHEMAVLYNVCDVFISIPKSDQFGSSLQEGMACGAIPIVGKLEVYRQYLSDGENALFVDAANPHDIAEKMLYCVEHPELKSRFYAINRKIIEENEDWAKNMRKAEELYRSLVRGDSVP